MSIRDPKIVSIVPRARLSPVGASLERTLASVDRRTELRDGGAPIGREAYRLARESAFDLLVSLDDVEPPEPGAQPDARGRGRLRLIGSGRED
jgi:hypothetical protein